MKRKFDKNDVLRFIYKEMDPKESEAFIEALTEDEELWQAFEAYQTAQQNLEFVRTEPSTSAVSKVLDHAKIASRRPNPLRFGKNKVLSVPFLVSTLMVFLTMITITSATFAFRGAAQNAEESLVSDDLPNLQWEDPAFESRMQRTRASLVNLTEDRAIVTPIYHNTYQLVNTEELSPSENKVVLLNLR